MEIRGRLACFYWSRLHFILVLSFVTLAMAQLRSNIEWFLPFLEGQEIVLPDAIGDGATVPTVRRLAEGAGTVMTTFVGRVLSGICGAAMGVRVSCLAGWLQLLPSYSCIRIARSSYLLPSS
mgnify:CR=1 FL=1